MAAQVKAHFAPKKPEPKPVYNEKTKKWAKSFLEQPSQISMNLESDYDREIIKQAQKKKITSAKSGKQVAQLGAQKNQSVAPLKVISDLDKAFRAEMDMDMQIMDPRARNNAALMGITVSQAKALANEANMSLGQYLGYEDTPVGQIVRQYVQGEPLVSNEELARLSTHMRNLHEWYMSQAEKKHHKDWFPVDVRKEHHFKPYSIQVQMTELFQLYNQRALDKSIIGCYCL